MVTTIGTTNVAADRVRLNLARLDDQLGRVTQRLSSGLRIPLESPGYVGVGARFEAEVRGLAAAGVSIQSGTSMLTIADVALGQIATLLGGMLELAVQAASGTLTDGDRAPLDAEFQQARTSIDAIVDGTAYQSTSLLDGTGGTVRLQVGASVGQTLDLPFTTDFSTAGLLSGLTVLDLTSQASAQTAVADLPGIQGDFAVGRVGLVGHASRLAALGAVNQQAQVEAIAGKDAYVAVDVARETSELVRLQLRQSAGAAALQVANFSASAVVDLLFGVADRAGR